MTITEHIITIGLCVLAVQITRLVSFWIFPAGKVLPAAMFGMLVIYCYKNIDIFAGHRGLPNFIAGALVLALHFWKKNMFLSISVGTLFYMVLVQQVFI